MVQDLIERAAHHAGSHHHDIETGQLRHFYQGGDAAPVLAHPARPRAVILDLGRCVGAITALVLQALNLNAVAGAVDQHAWREKAADPGSRARQCEECVAHRRRAEPLVAFERVGAIGQRRGNGLRAAQIRAALFFGHGHADNHGAFLRQRQGARIIGVGKHFGLPLGRELRFVTHHLHGRKGHGDGAGGAVLGLVPQVVERSTGHMSTVAPLIPGE